MLASVPTPCMYMVVPILMQHLFTNTNFVQIDVSKLPPGAYWIKFEHELGNHSSSFIKQ